MINSLMQLASIKIAIKDYKMAEKDFNEAIVLSKYKNDVLRQIDIEKCLATLYENTNRSKLALAIEKHCDFLAANINKITLEQAKTNAVRMATEAKLAAEKAKINKIKMDLLAKENKAKMAQIAIQRAKANKINEKQYLALLKATSKWPIIPVEAKQVSVIQKTQAETVKKDKEVTVLALNSSGK